jgi:hypothetical protein
MASSDKPGASASLRGDEVASEARPGADARKDRLPPSDASASSAADLGALKLANDTDYSRDNQTETSRNLPAFE